MRPGAPHHFHLRDFIMAATGDLTTELEAINEMLDAIQASQVDSIDTSISEVDLAQKLLNKVVFQIQQRGWSWNKVIKSELTPDGSNLIALPSNVIHAECPWYWNGGLIIVERERSLYNQTDNTFEFTANVFANLTFHYEFTDLPSHARHYAFIRAGRIFIQRMIGGVDFLGFQERDEREAERWMREGEQETAQHNLLLNQDSCAIVDRYGGVY